MKKIGLLTDSKIANLALMKIARYYKNKNYEVEWYNNSLLNSNIEKLFVSKIFTFTKLPLLSFYQGGIEMGGTGYGIKKKLPDEVEKSQPDYSIYPDCNYSIQLFSRGCIRKCLFCVVPKKEGNIRSINPMNLNPRGERIEIFDNNFFANPEWKKSIAYIQKINQPINIAQGVDVRILTNEQTKILNKLNHQTRIHIAWDTIDKITERKIKEMIKIISPHKIMCYVLIGFDTTHEENIYRIRKLHELKITPYVMPYKRDQYELDFGIWINMFVYKTIPWKIFIQNRRKYN